MSDTPKTDAFEALVNRPTNWWDFARELERENAALREKFMFAESEIILLREEREELRVDKERLDYMEQHVNFVSWRFYGKLERLDLRGTIDRKMKEAQP